MSLIYRLGVSRDHVPVAEFAETSDSNPICKESLIFSSIMREVQHEGIAVPFASNPFPMWIYDQERLQFLDVNDAAVRAYGFSGEEFLNMTVLDIRPDKHVSEFLHDWKHPHETTGEQ